MISYLYVRLSAMPRRVLFPLVLLAAVLATIAIPGVAHAAMVVAADEPTKGGWTKVGDGSGFQDVYLPVARWSDAASLMHTRTSGSDFNVTLSSMSKSQISGNLMLFGNFCYTLMVKIVEMSIYFDALETAGKNVDEAFATVGEAIGNSPIFTFVIVIAVTSALVIGARRRSGKPVARMLFKPVLLAAVFALLVAGASASTEKSPGKLGPWWTATMINNVVTALATGPATALQETDLGFGKTYSPRFEDDPMSCKLYMDTMADSYVTEGESKAATMSRSMALSLSNMWEATAVEAYSQAQFGGSEYADKTFCRLLDLNSPTPEVLSTSKEITESVTGETQDGSSSINGYNTVTDDISVLYWAACTWDGEKFGVDEDWAKMGKDGAVGEVLPKGDQGASCSKWWDEKPASAIEGGGFKNDDDDKNKNPLNIAASDMKDFYERTEGASGDIQNFISTFQGWTSTSSVIPAATFAFSSFLISCAFGILGLLVFGAKIGMVAMLLLLGLAIIMDMFPVAESKLKKYGMSYMGMALLAFGVQFVFSILVMLSSIIANAGAEFVGSNTIARSVWLGLAPIIAFVLLHMFITKWLKAPSPFSPSGAMAMMKGAAGGQLLGAGMSSLNRHRRNADRPDGSDGEVGAGAAAGGGVGGQRDETGQIDSGTTDKMNGRGGKPGSGTEDGTSPSIAAGGADAEGAEGVNAEADPDAAIGGGGSADGEAEALGSEGDGDSEGDPQIGSGDSEGKALDSEGEGSATGGEIVPPSGQGSGPSGMGTAGAAAAGAVGAAQSGGKRSYDEIKDEKKQKRQDALDKRDSRLQGRQRARTMAHNAKYAGGPEAGASLGAKAKHGMKRFASKTREVGSNSMLGARRKAVNAGGYRAVAGKAALGTGRAGLGVGKWATAGGGLKAGLRVARGAASGAVGVGLIAGGAATSFVSPGAAGAMASFGANRIRAGKNLTASGLRSDAIKGVAGRGSRAAWSGTKKAGSTVGGFSGRIANEQYRRAYTAFHNRRK